MSSSLTLAEIADTSGVPARTIRFYIARGILPGPSKGGRGAKYTAEHLARLEEIKRLQAEGRTLSEIATLMGGAGTVADVPQPSPWWQHAVADDVIVMVNAAAAPWRLKQVRSALAEFTRQLQKGNS